VEGKYKWRRAKGKGKTQYGLRLSRVLWLTYNYCKTGREEKQN
jgi:hypothetical protein